MKFGAFAMESLFYGICVIALTAIVWAIICRLLRIAGFRWPCHAERARQNRKGKGMKA